MKRKMTLWLLMAILGIWAAGAGLAKAAQAADSAKDKAATEKSDDGGLDVNWGDDAKKKTEPQTQPADKGKDEKPTTSSADDKDKPADKTKETDKAKDKDGEKPAAEEGEKEKEVAVLDSLEGFYADLARTSEMPEDQQKKLEIIQDKMKKQLELQEKKNEPEIEHLQKKAAKNDEKHAKKYLDKIEEIKGRLQKVEMFFHQQAIRTLKGEQIQKWNESLVWSKIEPDMTMLSISEEQRKKAKAVCGETVAPYKNKALPEEAGAKLKMNAVKKLLKDREVLDESQAKEYRRYLSEQLQGAKETGAKKTKSGR